MVSVGPMERYLHVLGRSPPTDTEMVGFLRSKCLVIDGYHNGSPDRQLLWTGSYNDTVGALRPQRRVADEDLGRPDIFSAFHANVQTVASHSYATIQAGSW